MKKALIGMSGGVDSSAAAYLTIQQGYTCIGATMKLWADVSADAEMVARKLGMEFYHFDLSRQFREAVVEPFVCSYEQGLTPNPCIACNRHLKFGLFLELADSLGCSHVVTGHYARITEENGRFLLKKAAEESKDQSYFLYRMTQQQLARTLFPLGDLSKAEARAIAESQGFLNAQKRDSQDICFIPDGDYMAFIRGFTGKTYEDGDFLDAEGNRVGRHHGAAGYTLGQRKGLGLAMGQPVYVCAKDMAANTVTVGSEEQLMHNALKAEDWNFIAIDALTQPLRVKAKTRSRQAEQPAWVYPGENGSATVVFDQPQRAITPGQAVVLYDGETVVGGGTITGAFSC